MYLCIVSELRQRCPDLDIQVDGGLSIGKRGYLSIHHSIHLSIYLSILGLSILYLCIYVAMLLTIYLCCYVSISIDTIDIAARAGANSIVAGSAVFNNPPGHVISVLRRSVEMYGNGKVEAELSPLITS
jgi:hypothetical protein